MIKNLIIVQLYNIEMRALLTMDGMALVLTLLILTRNITIM